MLTLIVGHGRCSFATRRARLLPPAFARVSERFQTPYRTTLVTGVAVAALAGLLSLDPLADLVNIGTLFAFVLVAIGIPVLRRTRPDLERRFRTPFVPVVPILSVLASGYLMLHLPAAPRLRLFVWMAGGLAGS